MEAHHYCSHPSEEVRQCTLWDSDQKGELEAWAAAAPPAKRGMRAALPASWRVGCSPGGGPANGAAAGVLAAGHLPAVPQGRA